VAYTHLTNLQPVIPAGTILRSVAPDPYPTPKESEVSSCGKLYPRGKIPTIGTPAAKENLNIRETFLAKVIEHDRSHQDEFELRITIVGGPFEGQTGWVDDGCFNDEQGADASLFEVPR
jgi:hypothetical protein